jgi:hypothetical protein
MNEMNKILLVFFFAMKTARCKHTSNAIASRMPQAIANIKATYGAARML